MPVTRSAQKKLRQDRVRQIQNKIVRQKIKDTLKKYKKTPSEKYLPQVYRVLDKAVKKNIFAANKASRLKSNLSQLLKKSKTPQISESSKTRPRKKTIKK